jgi:hypothetical protein
MKITNFPDTQGNVLPEEIMHILNKMYYKPNPARYSVTDLTQPPKIRTLKMTRWDEIEVPAMNLVSLIPHVGLHYYLDHMAMENTLTEEKLTIQNMGVTVVGKLDLFKDRTVKDWKMCSGLSFSMGQKIDWIQQGNVYKYMLNQHSFKVDKIMIYAWIKDWSKYKAMQDPKFPQQPFITLSVPFWENEQIEKWLNAVVGGNLQYPMRDCNPDERWERGHKFAIYKDTDGTATKKPKQKAVKLANTKVEAQEYIDSKKVPEGSKLKKKEATYFIHERAGVSVRCEDYCIVSGVCEQYKAIKKQQQEEMENENGEGMVESTETEGKLPLSE